MCVKIKENPLKQKNVAKHLTVYAYTHMHFK